MTLDELLAAARAEDPELRVGPAVDAFWEAVLNDLYQFFSRSFSRADSDDLVQLTLDVVLAKIGDFEPIGSNGFLRWLRVIAANKARACSQAPRRQQARLRRLGERRVLPSPVISPPSWVLMRERAELVEQHRGELPEHEARALAHEREGGDDRTLASREGIALNTARTRRRRARRNVAKRIEAARRTPAARSPSSSPNTPS